MSTAWLRPRYLRCSPAKKAGLNILSFLFKHWPSLIVSERLDTVDIDSETINQASGWPISQKALRLWKINSGHCIPPMVRMFSALPPDQYSSSRKRFYHVFVLPGCLLCRHHIFGLSSVRPPLILWSVDLKYSKPPAFTTSPD